MNKDEIKEKITFIFDNNQLDDLETFIYKRQCLNTCNVYLLYLFHLIQTIGIITTSYGTSLNNTNIIWTGIILNSTASLIQVFEKLNYSQLKKLLNDIQNIKNDKYTDETPLVDPEKDSENKGQIN